MPSRTRVSHGGRATFIRPVSAAFAMVNQGRPPPSLPPVDRGDRHHPSPLVTGACVARRGRVEAHGGHGVLFIKPRSRPRASVLFDALLAPSGPAAADVVDQDVQVTPFATDKRPSRDRQRPPSRTSARDGQGSARRRLSAPPSPRPGVPGNASRWRCCSPGPPVAWPMPGRCRDCRRSPGRTFRKGRKSHFVLRPRTAAGSGGFVTEEILAIEGWPLPAPACPRRHARLSWRWGRIRFFRVRAPSGTAVWAKPMRLTGAFSLPKHFFVDARRPASALKPLSTQSQSADDASPRPFHRFDDQILVERRQALRAGR